MSILSFDYDPALNCEVAEYKGFRIRAERDTDAENPWESWDGNIPCVYLSFGYGGRSDITELDKDAGIDILRPFSGSTISDAMLRRHLKAIAAACDYTPEYLDKEARNARHYPNESLTDYKRDLLDDALGGMSNSDRLEALQSIYSAIGWPALCTSSRGYSQGDYIELLFVVTPHFRKKMGMESARKYPASFWQKDMESARELFSAWAWGDVYGYVIDAPSGIDAQGEPEYSEHVDSCWGFYGDDHDKSGLEEGAINAVDCIVRYAGKRRSEKLKEIISNRVPLALRADILAAAGDYESAAHA